MPVIQPFVSDVKATPRLTELESLADATAGTASTPKIEHGHALAPAVVNVQFCGDIVTPPVLVAPLRLAEYWVDALSELVGVKVRTVLPLPSDVVPATVFPLGSLRVKTAVPGWIALLNVIVTAVVTGTLVAWLDGTVVADGGLVSAV